MNSLFTSLLVSGSDTRTFLQGQLTCDMDALKREHAQLACINSPQGRVQAVVTVIEHDPDIVLQVIATMAERTAERLQKYVLRSKVKIEVSSDTALLSDSSASLLSQLRAGIPHIFPETHETFVAQMLNLDALGAISFNKGCYTGQEIIARTHYRGAVKRRMFRFAADCAPPEPGSRILSDGEHAGDVVYAAATEQGCEFLSVVNLAQAEAALRLDSSSDERLQPLLLPYSV